MQAQFSVKKDKLKPLGVRGNNILIGYYDTYAIVYDEEKDELFYFYMKDSIDTLLFSCVEKEMLNPITNLPQEIQLAIQHKFLEA